MFLVNVVILDLYVPNAKRRIILVADTGKVEMNFHSILPHSDGFGFLSFS